MWELGRYINNELKTKQTTKKNPHTGKAALVYHSHLPRTGAEEASTEVGLLSPMKRFLSWSLSVVGDN